jgi:hypothetical protein
MMLIAMDNKTWLLEVAIAAFFFAGAITALTLMVGHGRWMRPARK